MKYIMFILAVVFAFEAYSLSENAINIMQQIYATLKALCASVLFVGAIIICSIDNLIEQTAIFERKRRQ